MATIDETLAAAVELFRGAGLAASQNPAELNPPGVWLALDTVAPATVSGSLLLGCSVYLVAADTDPARANRKLGELFGVFLTVARPDGEARTLGVVMPGDPTPLPALQVPLNLNT